MLEKVMPKWRKTVPKWSPKGSQNREKCAKNACKKRCRNLTPKRDTRGTHGREVGGSLLLRFNTDRQYLPTVTTQTVTKNRQAKTDGRPQPLARQSRQARWRIYIYIYIYTYTPFKYPSKTKNFPCHIYIYICDVCFKQLQIFIV